MAESAVDVAPTHALVKQWVRATGSSDKQCRLPLAAVKAIVLALTDATENQCDVSTAAAKKALAAVAFEALGLAAASLPVSGPASFIGAGAEAAEKDAAKRSSRVLRTWQTANSVNAQYRLKYDDVSAGLQDLADPNDPLAQVACGGYLGKILGTAAEPVATVTLDERKDILHLLYLSDLVPGFDGNAADTITASLAELRARKHLVLPRKATTVAEAITRLTAAMKSANKASGLTDNKFDINRPIFFVGLDEAIKPATADTRDGIGEAGDDGCSSALFDMAHGASTMVPWARPFYKFSQSLTCSELSRVMASFAHLGLVNIKLSDLVVHDADGAAAMYTMYCLSAVRDRGVTTWPETYSPLDVAIAIADLKTSGKPLHQAIAAPAAAASHPQPAGGASALDIVAAQQAYAAAPMDANGHAFVNLDIKFNAEDKATIAALELTPPNEAVLAVLYGAASRCGRCDLIGHDAAHCPLPANGQDEDQLDKTIYVGPVLRANLLCAGIKTSKALTQLRVGVLSEGAKAAALFGTLRQAYRMDPNQPVRLVAYGAGGALPTNADLTVISTLLFDFKYSDAQTAWTEWAYSLFFKLNNLAKSKDTVSEAQESYAVLADAAAFAPNTLHADQNGTPLATCGNLMRDLKLLTSRGVRPALVTEFRQRGLRYAEQTATQVSYGVPWAKMKPSIDPTQQCNQSTRRFVVC